MDPTYTLTPTLFAARLLSPDRIRARRQLEKMRQQTNGQQGKGQSYKSMRISIKKHDISVRQSFLRFPKLGNADAQCDISDKTIRPLSSEQTEQYRDQ